MTSNEQNTISAEVELFEVSKEQYDKMLLELLNDCNNPPKTDGVRPNGLIINRSLLSNIVSELIKLRALKTHTQDELIKMISDMVFTQAVSDISNMIENMGSHFDCEHMATVAQVVRNIRAQAENDGAAHGRC